MMFQVLSLMVLALASANAEFKADCTDPCTCNGVSWKGKFPYPYKFSAVDSSGKTYEYTFSPCGVKVDCGNTSKPVVICQTDPTVTENANVVVGASSSIVWTFANASDTSHLTVTYGDGDKTYSGIKTRKGVVSVTVTAHGGPSFLFTGEDDTQDTELDYDFAAKIAAKIPPDGGVSVGIAGIVLICLLLGAVILYFIIGAIIMFQVKGARGIEVVPNYTFWKDLPSLIKDGFLFTFQPCTGECRCTGECSKKNTYSSLS